MSRARISRLVSRRDILKILGVMVGHNIAAGVQLFPAPPTPPPAATPEPRTTPLSPVPTTTEHRQYFVPLDNYHELPANCYAQNVIQPLEIILHWDGNRQGRGLWLAPVTYQTLAYVQQSSHFAVDYKRIWQLLPMFQTLVQESYGAKGYNWESINVEMAGTEFDLPGNLPPEGEVQLTLRLVSQLMDYYGIAFEHVVGHFERDPRGDKRDPGPVFLASFRDQLAGYRSGRSNTKRLHLANPY